MKSLFMLVLFWPIGLTLAADKTITCYHTQVCNMVHFLIPEAKLEVIELARNSDPHHYELTGGDLKKILSAELFISPSMFLTPWLAQAIKQRKAIDTISLETDSSKKPQEAYAHFWLYKEGLCKTLTFLKENLIERKYKIREVHCSDLQLGPTLDEKKNTLLVMTHDSLLPLAQELNLSFLTARSSAHEHDINTKTLKDIATQTKTRPTVWVIENQIKIPTTLLNLIKKDDKVIKINTNGDLFEAPGETLSLIMKELISDK